MFVRFLLLAILVTMPSPLFAQGTGIEEAYKAIPHRRTPFDPGRSGLAQADAKYLDHLFFVTDMALVLRVRTLQEFLNLNPHGIQKYNKEINGLIATFELIDTPPHLQAVQDDVLGAIQDQQKFFSYWSSMGGTPEYHALRRAYQSHPLVLDSHKKLLSAYGRLKSLYPSEIPHNQQAFFDHLCGLDFI